MELLNNSVRVTVNDHLYEKVDGQWFSLIDENDSYLENDPIECEELIARLNAAVK